MGHIHARTPPDTRRWRAVVGLMAAGAGVPQVAQATLHLAERGLRQAAGDRGVVEAVWLLVRLPDAARTGDFAAALSDSGIDVPGPPGVIELVAAVSDAVDRAVPNGRGRTDLGEMAQAAAAETIAGVLAESCRGLFGTHPADVQAAVAGLDPPGRFGPFGERFFARFLFKCLDYFLSMATALHVGEGRRFRTLADQRAFTDALEAHCRETAGVMDEYSGKWRSKARFEGGGDIDRERVGGFVGYGITKLADELRRRGGGHG